MTGTVDLKHKAELPTIKVHDKPIKHVLAPELEPEHLAVSQQRPCLTLLDGELTPQFAGPLEFD